MKKLFYFFCANLIFFSTSAQTTKFIISTTTTIDADEHRWKILDSDSVTVLYSSPTFSDSTTQNDTIELNDCSNFYFHTFSSDTADTTWSDGSSVYVIGLESSDTIIQTVGYSPPFIDTIFSASCKLMINEIHYDNIGADTLEGVEIVGKAGYDLSCYKIYLYNGADSLMYDSLSLSGIIPNDSCGYGAIWFPIVGIQNGDLSSGDAIALANICSNYKVQFLSYEGSFAAKNGLFKSDIAVDIGVSESSTTPINTSMQLLGFGEDYFSFTWVTSLPSTRNTLSIGQSFCSPDLELLELVLDSVCEALNPVNTRLVLTNVGSIPFSNFSVNYSINGGATISEIVSDTLMPLDTIHYSFMASEDFTNANGDYTINSWCTLGRDSNSTNDSLSTIVNFIDIVASDTNICYGDTVLLSPSFTNASNYIWSSGDTTSSISVAPLSSTTYSIIASNSCFSDTAYINVSVSNPTLSLGSDLILCGADTILLDATSNFSSYAWSSGDSVQIKNVTQGGIYSVVVSDSLGCVTSDTISIFHSIPQVNLGADLNICGHDSIVLSVSSFTSYAWSNGDTLQSSTITQVGEYIVSVVDSLGCMDSDTVQVFQSASTIDLGPSVTALCGANDTITLDATSNYSSYAWSTSDTLQSIIVYQIGTYSVTVTDSLGCTASDSIEIVQSNPTLDLGSDLILCGADTILLDATANFSSYTWSSGDSVQIKNVTQGGIYSVVVTDSLGCVTSDTISIFHSIPQVNLGADLNICGLDSIVLSVSSFTSYAWSNGDTLQSSTITQLGEYIVSVVDSLGCMDSDTVQVSRSASSIDLGPSVTALCGANDTITLDATSNYSSYVWSTSDTLQSIAVYQTGTYNVTVTDSLGCTASDSIEIIQSNPTLDLGSDISTCNYSSLTLSSTESFSTYLWSNSDTTQTTNVNQEGIYSLIVTDNYGCEAFDTIVVTFNGPSLDLGPDVIVCEGDYHTFYVANNYNSYQWSQGGLF